MKRTVYIETTIPSFYHEVRSDHAMVARRDSTRRWWADDREQYELGLSIPIVTTPDLLLAEAES